MYVLCCNKEPVIASEYSDNLEEVIQSSIDSIINNKLYDNVHYNQNEVWYYNGVNHIHKVYEIKDIQVI